MVNISETELKILEFWRKDKTFEKSLKNKKKEYVFYDGPPFATGLPHYGHLLASTIKDTIPRFWTMRGYKVDRVWGWDCHGLPVENIVEKKLNFQTKKQIESLGVNKFCEVCESTVLQYVHDWKSTIERLGRWVEFDKSYKTMDVSYMESVWWAFKEIWKKGLIYEGRRVLMYCPRCETPVSKAEVAMDNSYKEVTDESVIISFNITDKKFLKEKCFGKKTSFVAWTTTPWSIPTTMGLAVGPEINYALVRAGENQIICAKARLDYVMKNLPRERFSVVKDLKGKEIVGVSYDHPFDEYSSHPEVEGNANIHKTYPTDYVSIEEGTGIVTINGAFGEIDYESAQKFKLPVIVNLTADGRYDSFMGELAGHFVKSNENPRATDIKICKILEERGALWRKEPYRHPYPHCWRCENPLIYRAIPAWFMNIQKIKPLVIKLNEKIEWYPEHLKYGRFLNTVETAPDWNLSRNRYWASVIPVWKCSCGKVKVIGSIDELKKEAVNFPKKIDLHKPTMDKVKLKCGCGKEMTRVPEVLDCWFESGSMPFAQVHYPFENKQWFEKHFPGDFVAEYIAQTRTWFYYMLVISAILFEKQPFKNVVTTGTILAEDGEKMSKSRGNFTDPEKIISKYGADSLRFYMLSNPIMAAEDLRFSDRGVEEVYKKVILLLYNSLNFYSFNKTLAKPADKPKLNLLDKWIYSRLAELNMALVSEFESYNTIGVCRAIALFIDDLSTWYIRRSRDRFGEDAKNAIAVLKEVLREFAIFIAPMLPFAAETIYHAVGDGKNSVHLEAWPKAGKIDKKIIEQMALARQIVSLALKERDDKKLILRQPLQKIIIKGAKIDEKYKEIIADEVNIKEIKFTNGKELSVELDTTITPELEAEGFVREIVRRIQSERKARNMKKEQRIQLKLFVSDKLNTAIVTHKEFIRGRVGADKLDFVDGKTKNLVFFDVKNEHVGFIF
ncbi:MAG: isoleucine--tRNA ligase [Nanoarchaeota archaeon]